MVNFTDHRTGKILIRAIGKILIRAIGNILITEIAQAKSITNTMDREIKKLRKKPETSLSNSKGNNMNIMKM